MSDEAAFLRSIAANPHDDTARLVYADWLDDWSDPRAEYVRVEVRWANTVPEDAEYERLRQRLHLIRHNFDREWVNAAGRRYNVVLLKYDVPEHRAVIGRLAEVLAVDRRQAARFLRTLPGVVLQGLPFWPAEVASWRLKGGRNLTTGAGIGVESARAYSVVVPSGSAPGPTDAAKPRTREEATALMRAEARRLGITLDGLLQPDCTNRVVQLVTQFFASVTAS